MKKFQKSPIAIVCYVIAALLAVYFIAVIVSTMRTISEYYAAYNMSPGFGETVAYIMQNGLSPLVSAITMFMAGFILEEVRKLNPSNWMTDDELADAREAKKMAREAKQIAKGEAAKAKAEAEAEAEAAREAEEAAEPEFAAVVAEDGEEDDTVVFEEDEEGTAAFPAEELQEEETVAFPAEEAEKTEAE